MGGLLSRIAGWALAMIGFALIVLFSSPDIALMTTILATLAAAAVILGALALGTPGAMLSGAACAGLTAIKAYLHYGTVPATHIQALVALLVFAVIISATVGQMRKFEKHYQLMIERANDAVYRLNVRTGTLEYMSPAFERIAGYPADELISMSRDQIRDIIHPDDRDKRRQMTRELLLARERAQQIMEYRIRHRDGHYVWLSDSRHVVFDGRGEPVAIEGVDRDISARKEWEQALRESEERYRLLVEGSQTLFFYIHDTEGRFSFVSGSVLYVLGYSPQELVGRRYQDSVVDARDLDQTNAITSAALADGRRGPPYLIRARTRDGTTRLLEMVESPLIRDGMVLGMQGFARDVTAHRAAQDALVKNTRRLTSLHEVAKDLASCLSAEDVYDTMLKASVDVLGFEYVCLCLLRQGEFDALVHPAHSPEDPNGSLRPDEDIACHTYRQGETFVSCDVPGAKQARSLVSIPLGDVGVFQIMSTRVGAFDSDDVTVAELLAGHAVQSLGRLDLEDELRHQAIHDRVTGLYSRSFFETEMERLGTGRWHPVSIIVADVDGLKLINDTMGHRTGDEVLRRCAAILRASVRRSDVAARIGGDEFALILPATPESTAGEILKRVRQAVETDNASHPGLPLSLSAGLSTASLPGSPLDDVLRKADDLMYRDKLNRSSSARSAIVNALVAAVAERDFVAQGHGDRILAQGTVLGQLAGLGEEDLEDLELLLRTHDLGNVGIPDTILYKPSPLTGSEREVMKRHAEVGYRVISSAPGMSHIAGLVLHHHEWWDGTGYPLGLAGHDIPVQCRIVAIVRAFNAMTSDHPYRKALPVDQALSEINLGAGSQFDPDLVKLFMEGQLWEISTGSKNASPGTDL